MKRAKFSILVGRSLCSRDFYHLLDLTPVTAGALLVFGTAVWCQGTTLAIIHYSGDTLSALLIVIPPLRSGAGCRRGNPSDQLLLRGVGNSSPSEAAVHCFLDAMAALFPLLRTTMMGTASLMVSELEPIRLFGAYATIGVGLT